MGFRRFGSGGSLGTGDTIWAVVLRLKLAIWQELGVSLAVFHAKAASKKPMPSNAFLLYFIFFEECAFGVYIYIYICIYIYI